MSISTHDCDHRIGAVRAAVVALMVASCARVRSRSQGDLSQRATAASVVTQAAVFSGVDAGAQGSAVDAADVIEVRDTPADDDALSPLTGLPAMQTNMVAETCNYMAAGIQRCAVRHRRWFGTIDIHIEIDADGQVSGITIQPEDRRGSTACFERAVRATGFPIFHVPYRNECRFALPSPPGFNPQP